MLNRMAAGVNRALLSELFERQVDEHADWA
jgi:hypothetical protein